MKKRKLFAMLGAVTLIGAIGGGSTFAYLTSQTGTVTNTFTVGNVNFDEEAGLTESAVEREDGVYVDADGEDIWSVTENTYENLVAGETVYKDPTVHMADNSENAWVFAKIVNANDSLEITYSTDWADVTDEYKAAHPDETVDFSVYAKTSQIAKGEDSTIFTNVTVGDDVTEDTEFTAITVKACAVQAAGFDSYDNEDLLKEVVFE